MSKWRSVEDPPEHRGDVWVWPAGRTLRTRTRYVDDETGWYQVKLNRWFDPDGDPIEPRLWREIDWPEPPGEEEG